MNGKGEKKPYKEKYIAIEEKEILPIGKDTFQIGGKHEATSSKELLDTCEGSYTFPLLSAEFWILLEPGKFLLLSVGAGVPELSKDATVWPNT